MAGIASPHNHPGRTTEGSIKNQPYRHHRCGSNLHAFSRSYPESPALNWLTAMRMSRVTWVWALSMVKDDPKRNARAEMPNRPVGVGSAARRDWRLLPVFEPLLSRSFRIVASSVAVSDAGRSLSAASMFALSVASAVAVAWSKAA